MQLSTAEETIQRLIFSLSELEQLGQTLISGHSNFNVSSKTYLRIALGTLQSTRGAILRYHPVDNHLSVAASAPERRGDDSATPLIPVEPEDVVQLLQHPSIQIGSPPTGLEGFFARHAEVCTAIDARLWVPLKIHDELLGILSLGRFLGRAQLEEWENELLTILAHQISIAIAYSQMMEGIQGEKFRLFMLAESAPLICQLLQPDDAAQQVVHQAVSLLDANAGGLLLRDSRQTEIEWKYTFPETLAAEFPSTIPLDDGGGDADGVCDTEKALADVAREGRTAQTDTRDDVRLGADNIMAVPILGRDGDVLGVLVVGDKEERGGRITAFTDEDAILLDSFAKQAGVAMENAQLHQEALEARQLQAEMEEARKIQENLIPETLPDIPGYEVAGLYEPRGAVGGDYFDCLEVSNNRWGLTIADVSGKGMQAALLMATLRAGLLSEVAKTTDSTNLDEDTAKQLCDMALTLNSLLYASGTEEKFATFFYTYLNPETDTLTTLNAGHNPPLIVRSDGKTQWIGEDIGGLPLGMFPNDMVPLIAEYAAEQVQLNSGDIVIYYTDGVTETVNIEDEDYEVRLEPDALEASKLPEPDASNIIKHIHDAVIAFQGEADQFDDLTLLVLKKK